MKFILFGVVLVSLALVVIGTELTEEHIESQWQKFKVDNNRVYPNPETEASKRATFKQTLIRVTEHNKRFDAGETTYTEGINQFADLTQEEFKKQYTGGLALPPGWGKPQH